MKLLFVGTFLAALAMPVAFVTAVLAFLHVPGGWPNALHTAMNTASGLIFLSSFVFLSGLFAKNNIQTKESLKNSGSSHD